jgi:hypothetical protein
MTEPEHTTTRPYGGATAPQAEAEQVCGRKLPAELFQLKLWGVRLVVIREEVERKHGSIILVNPEKFPKSVGWVIAVGPEVGLVNLSRPGWSPYPPEELLLQKVLFGRYAGMAIPVQVEPGTPDAKAFADFAKDDTTPAVMITDGDILANY